LAGVALASTVTAMFATRFARLSPAGTVLRGPATACRPAAVRARRVDR